MVFQPLEKRWCRSMLHGGAAALLVCTSALADDTEIYGANIAADTKPNILFVLDYSASMNESLIDGGPTKIDILKSAVRQVMESNVGKINVGVGPLYRNRPTGIVWPISDLTADANTIDPDIPVGTKTARDIASGQLDSIGVTNATATVSALAVAASYFRGGPVTHNYDDPLLTPQHQPNIYSVASERYESGNSFAANLNTYVPRDAYKPTGGTGAYWYCDDYSFGIAGDPGNYCDGLRIFECVDYGAYSGSSTGEGGTGETWTRPARRQCKYERDDSWTPPSYKSPLALDCQANAIILVSDGEPTTKSEIPLIESILGGETCEDLGYIWGDSSHTGAVNGQCGPEIARELANNPQVAGLENSTVTTYTVGFSIEGPGQTYLKKLAEAGNGTFFDAGTPEALSESLDSILSGLLISSQSFSPPAVDVNRSNFSHEDKLYYSMFKPSSNQSWGGNLKGYFMGDGELMDINNNPATEVKDGVRVMRDDAQSFWSRTPDGDDVLAGGASALLENGGRKLLTYVGPSEIPTSGVLLTSGSLHNLDSSNLSVTDAMLGGTGNRTALLDWIQTARMGDALHSQPVQVNYEGQRVMYIMTNQGFLHAIDATTPTEPDGNSDGGEELFAFMPQELLKNVPKHYANESTTNRTYGLDGALVRWHDDENNDGIVNGADRMLLVFGMRRGGSHYYALDVTSPASPKLMWRIDGDSAEFPRLGETWSRPSLIQVLENGVKTKVLAFGGGYDAAQIDGIADRQENTLGNAIYMVNQQGKKVLSIDSSNSFQMKYAIPSDLTVIDSNNDGAADRIYVGDLGGQLWRIDFDDIKNGASAEVLASLHDGQQRMFFYPPSVALNSSVYGDFLSISIGSGNRTNPLRLNSNDKFYMVRDNYVDEPLPGSHSAISLSDLYNASNNSIGSTDKLISEDAREKLKVKAGWYIELGPNEKSLSQVVTFEDKLLATTFDVDSAAIGDPCKGVGTNYYYMMDVATAQPVPPSNLSAGDVEFTAADRKQLVNGDGILSQPKVIFPPNGGDPAVLVDNELVSTFDQKISRIFWHSK